MARRKPGRKLRNVEIIVNKKTYTIPLRIVDKSDRYSSRTELSYVIDVDEPCEVNVSDPDPNECIAKAKTVIEDRLAISWKDVLHVSIGKIDDHDFFDDEDSTNEESERSHGFTLRWKRKQIGRRGDEPCYRDAPRHASSNPHIWKGELEVGNEDTHRRDAVLYAVIDDTETNRNALAHIGMMLDTLQKRLNEVLAPKTIVATLADVTARLPLLLQDGAPSKPTPQKKTKKKTAKKARTPKKIAKKAVRRKS